MQKWDFQNAMDFAVKKAPAEEQTKAEKLLAEEQTKESKNYNSFQK